MEAGTQSETSARERALIISLGAAQAAESVFSDQLMRLATSERSDENKEAYNLLFDIREQLLEAQKAIEGRLKPDHKFPLGRIVVTPGALGVLTPEGAEEFDREALKGLVDRHAAGDWGTVDDEDKATNDRAVEEGSRLMSAYVHDGEKLWVITEADRSATTILTLARKWEPSAQSAPLR